MHLSTAVQKPSRQIFSAVQTRIVTQRAEDSSGEEKAVTTLCYMYIVYAVLLVC
jgi:hypothetical protein